jgi:putative membrane protein
MKTMKFLSLIITGVCILQACHNSEKEKQSGTMSSDSSVTVSANGKQTKLSKEETTFIEQAAFGGMMEIEAGNDALQKSKNPKIKELAQMIVNDHTKANQELDSIARNKGLKLPSAYPIAEQKQISALKELNAASFDHNYLGMMVKDHILTLEKFRLAAKYEDPAIKAFAIKSIPVLENHYAKANALDSLYIKQKMNNGDDILNIDKSSKKPH